MNINRIVKRIKRSLGIYAMASPIEDIDGEIIDILSDTTLPVFSIYLPQQLKIPISVDMIPVTHSPNEPITYILPDFKEKDILYVLKLDYDDRFYSSGCICSFPYRGNPSLPYLQSSILANAEKNIIDNSMPSLTYHFEQPRTLYIYDMIVSGNLIATLGVSHDKSFMSIPETASESFFKLAILDVKAGIYPIYKAFENVESPISGRIELKIEDWASAEKDREELIAKWDDDYLLDLVGYQYH